MPVRPGHPLRKSLRSFASPYAARRGRAPLSFGHFPRKRRQTYGPSSPSIPCESRFALSRPLTLREGDGKAGGRGEAQRVE